MGSHLEFTGPMVRENGVVPTRITNRLEHASDLSIHGTDLSAVEITAMIARVDKLMSLKVSGHALTDEHLRAIAVHDRLQDFQWRDAGGVTDAAAVHFQELSHLRVFRLGHSEITSAFVASLAKRRQLWQVACHDCLVDDEVTQTLKVLADLRVLSLARTFVTGATLGDLAATRCVDLTLDGCDLNVEALGEALGRLSALKSLSVDDTQVGDDHVHCLIGLPDLTLLSLRNTQISDQALTFFTFLPKKTTLLLTGSKVTAGGLAELQAKRPDLILTV